MLDPSYSLLGSIEAPTNSVNALAFSKDGRYLASCGDDLSVRVYDVRRNLSMIWNHRGKSPFTTVIWRKDSLFVGNSDAFLSDRLTRTSPFPWQYWLNKRREQLIAELYNPIYFLELDPTGNQLLVCSGSRTSLLVERNSGQWKLRSHFDSPSSFAEIPSFGEPDGFEEPQVLATSAHFLDEMGCVVVGYLHHGLWKYQTESGMSVLVWGPDEKIGSTALSPDGTALVATNIRSGLDWFRVSANTKWKKMSSSSEVQDSNSNIPLPVCFIDKGKHVVMGTSKGYAAILHTKHGKKLVSLDHGNEKTWITALAYVHPPKKSQLIATGDGNCGADTRIKVWIQDSETDDVTSLLKEWSLLLNVPVRWLHWLLRPLGSLIRISYHVFAIAGLAFLILHLLSIKHVEDIRQSVDTLFSWKSPISVEHPLPTITPEKSYSNTPHTRRPHTRTRESFAQKGHAYWYLQDDRPHYERLQYGRLQYE
ncbi:WD40-repeat-containing domain protein [Lentinula raphanica]|nr:WD40-repeat-containing domain protein [Lentinula raphanica]